MAWYAYCLTEQSSFFSHRARRPFPIEGLHGIAGAQVLAYPGGEFAVMVSEYVRPGALDQKSALEHAHVIAECFQKGTVLPFRFATIFDSDEAIRQAVRVNRKVFLQTVSDLRGKSEMHIKLMLNDGAPLTDVQVQHAGNAYLSQLRERAVRDRERQTKARAISVQMHKLFNPLQEDVSCKRNDRGELLLDIAHLIESDSVEKYHSHCSAAARHFKDVRIVITGPWPPYHFMPGKLRTVSEN
jgi:hypothetical protein